MPTMIWQRYEDFCFCDSCNVNRDMRVYTEPAFPDRKEVRNYSSSISDDRCSKGARKEAKNKQYANILARNRCSTKQCHTSIGDGKDDLVPIQFGQRSPNGRPYNKRKDKKRNINGNKLLTGGKSRLLSGGQHQGDRMT